MASVKLSRGGSPVINYHQCEGSPQFTSAPYGQLGLPHTPHLNAHADDALTTYNYNLSFPLRPSVLEVERNGLRDKKPVAGENVYLVYVPVNHMLDAIRIDISEPDPIMAGMTIAPVGALEAWNPATSQFELAEIPDILAAATAQGVANIPLDKPSTTFFSMWKQVSDAAVTASGSGTAPSGGGTVNVNSTGSASGSYIAPYYVKPVLNSLTAANGSVIYEWHESGALHLGFKIKTPATVANNTLDLMQGVIHFMAICRTFECQTSL